MKTELEQLKSDHTREAIGARLSSSTSHSYLRDFVYGGIDGAVTTFAVVSGVAGAGLSSGVVIVLGFANLVGDGFSMAASNYLGSKADRQLLEMTRQIELHHIDRYPEGEREEIRQILAGKGFGEDVLEAAVDTITSDRDLWVNTMLQEEHGLSLERPDPVRAATVTFLAFIAIGVLPLVAFVIDYFTEFGGHTPFVWSSFATAVAFFAVGAIKSRFVADRWYRSGLETLFVGGSAAFLAYIIGALLKGFA